MSRLPGKFTVRHYRRGELDENEFFVLVPSRDPAAVAAVLAYAEASPDASLAADLRAWLRDQVREPTVIRDMELTHAVLRTDGTVGVAGVAKQSGPVSDDDDARTVFTARVASWTAVLADEVASHGMTVATALQRIAGHAWREALIHMRRKRTRSRLGPDEKDDIG